MQALGARHESSGAETGVATADADELREALLDAAARVFARQGYEGTRIGDVVREAGLSTGAVYGRFGSKEDLLREAVISRSVPHVRAVPEGQRVGDLVVKASSHIEPHLSPTEALLLETFVAARRHEEIAGALADAATRWRAGVAPLVAAAVADGSLDPGLDVDAVLYFIRVLRLGRLLVRASGLRAPEPEAWERLVERVIGSLGAAGTSKEEET